MKEYEGKAPIGYIQLLSFGGIEILDINNEEAVACFNFGNGREMIKKHKIRRNANGRPYIRKMDVMYYLDHFMRA